MEILCVCSVVGYIIIWFRVVVKLFTESFREGVGWVAEEGLVL